MASIQRKKTPQKKETPGLLMSIIRTLSSGANVNRRAEEKSRLEKAYRESDAKLDKLVHEHMSDLTSIMQAFSTISNEITSSQQRIRAIKENVQSCKNLLHCKRDELRKLWIEGIEHKTAVAMLDQIEDVKDVMGKLQGHIDKKHYLHAADLLISSVQLLDGDLADVEALKDVKAELLSKKEELYQLLLQELHRQIYVKSTSTVVKGFQRNDSLRFSTRGERNMPLSSKPIPLQPTDADLLAEENLRRLKAVNLDQVAAPQEVREDVNCDSEDDVVHFFTLLVESLATLNKLPEAIEALRSNIRPGLLTIVQRSSLQVSDSAYLEGENISNVHQPQYFLELLELVCEQFSVVACAHQVVLASMQRIRVSKIANIYLYETGEVWVQIQAVVKILLSDYLDIRNTTSSNTPDQTAFEEPATEIRNYFLKKRPARPKKSALFRFDASSHAISMSSYLREQRQEFYGSGELLSSTDGREAGKMQFVCKPCTNNITTIYNSVQKFISEIETATFCTPGSCALQVFVTDFIRNIYLGQVLYNTQASIDAATKGFESQRAVIDLRTQQELGVAKPLLKGTVAVVTNIDELCRLIQDLPHYADQFLNMICKILHDYRETCLTSYQSIIQCDAEEKRIISAMWSKDEDINRFLRCLPNWRGVKEERTTAQQMTEEDLRAMNAKESAILTANLSTDQPLAESETISDPPQLGTLANLCESLDWFSTHIDGLVRKFGSGKTTTTTPATSTVGGLSQKAKPAQTMAKVSEKILKIVADYSAGFQDLSEVCLLVLHLEVRVHCFYYLIPLTKQQTSYCNAIDDMDPDVYVLKLNKDLSAIEDTLQQSLQLKRFKYIFEGLGHLVSSILINSTQYLKRINENGIKKMCRNIFSVQQSLTNITLSREADLDHAKQFYELLYLSPDDILKALVARGPQFSEQEYGSLLTLAYRSERGAGSHSLYQLLKTLEEILTEYDSIV